MKKKYFVFFWFPREPYKHVVLIVAPKKVRFGLPHYFFRYMLPHSFIFCAPCQPLGRFRGVETLTESDS